MNETGKVTRSHQQRTAYLYIRQSSVYQATYNQESTARQYRFRDRAGALGWPSDRIVVIDEDQGQSGESATERTGFQRLAADVGLGKVGIVLSLEVSRLARNCADWHRLLEICALTDTLIADEDGLYDPNQFNDRLILGLRGTMSEAELHFLRARLQGGKLNKARRGELKLMLPPGLVYDDAGRVVLDPDRQVQHAIRLVFDTFERDGSAWGVVRTLARQQVQLPPCHPYWCGGEGDGLGRADIVASAQNPSEPPLRRGLLLWPDPAAPGGRNSAAAPAGMEGPDPQRTSRLHHLGTLPPESGRVGGQ